MPNSFFQFKKFIVRQNQCAMKVCTDSCILGAYAASSLSNLNIRTVLDIGGGTGLLTLMLAQKANGQTQFTSVEINQDAFRQMKDNFHHTPWSEQLHPVGEDIRSLHTGMYDLIISNPPFYENYLKGNCESRTLAMHDTGLHLDELAKVISAHLNPDGRYFVMVPFDRLHYLAAKLEIGSLQVSEVLTVQHSPDHSPFRAIISGKPGKTAEAIKKTSLVIYNGDTYTENFKNLLKDYYLYL